MCLIPASGGDVRFLARTGSNKHPDGLSWSPDSTQLAFVKRNGKSADIFIVSTVTGKERPLLQTEKRISNPLGPATAGGLPICRNEVGGSQAVKGGFNRWTAASQESYKALTAIHSSIHPMESG